MAPSKSTVLYGGRIVFGPNLHGFLFTNFLLLAPTILFNIFTAPFFKGPLIVLPVIGGVLFLICISALYWTTLTDPGIIPRVIEDVDEEDPFAPLKRVVHVGNRDLESKFCQTCHIYRPVRSTHCSICNNCVDRFDHHCPWTSNCIGRRNYRFFLAFIFSVPVYSFWIMGLCIWHVVASTQVDGTFVNGLRIAPISFVLIFYAFAGVSAIGVLVQFHCSLLASNVTTNEKLTYKYMTGNPFKRSFVDELYWVWFGPRTISFVRYNYKNQAVKPTTEQLIV